jgi:hypothetical protein
MLLRILSKTREYMESPILPPQQRLNFMVNIAEWSSW